MRVFLIYETYAITAIWMCLASSLVFQACEQIDQSDGSLKPVSNALSKNDPIGGSHSPRDDSPVESEDRRKMPEKSGDISPTAIAQHSLPGVKMSTSPFLVSWENLGIQTFRNSMAGQACKAANESIGGLRLDSSVGDPKLLKFWTL